MISIFIVLSMFSNGYSKTFLHMEGGLGEVLPRGPHLSFWRSLMVEKNLEEKLTNLRISLDHSQNLKTAAIRETGTPQLAQLTAHLALCQRVLEEIKAPNLPENIEKE